ncbi:MAG: hypothetical protein R2861_16455 [Desulfobacterales bacterium]
MAGPGRPGDLEQALSVLETVVLCPGPDACPAKLPPAFHPWCCNSWRRMRRRQPFIFVKISELERFHRLASIFGPKTVRKIVF